MILMGDRKKSVLQILGPREGEGEISPLRTCVEELIEAVHAKDVEGTLASLKACVSHIDSEPQTEEE